MVFKKMTLSLIAKFSLYIFLLILFIGTKPYFLDNEFDASGDTDPIRFMLVMYMFSYVCICFFNGSLTSSLRGCFLKYKYFIILYLFIIFTIPFAYSVEFSVKRTFVLLVVSFFLFCISNNLSMKSIIGVLLNSLFIVLVVNLMSYIFLAPISYDHEDLFKGIHVHKNTAGAVFALSLIAFFILLNNFYLKFLSCSILFYFLILSGSKTSLALTVFCIAFLIVVNSLNKSGYTIFFIIKSMTILTFTVLAIYIGVDDLFFAVGDAYGDRTFTGRSIIWEYVYEKFKERPLVGWGYGSFWGLGNISPALFDGGDFIALFGQAHNGYLDLATQIGVIGLFICIFSHLSIFIALFGSLGQGDNQYINFVFSVVTFFILHNLLESTILMPFSILWPVVLLLSLSYLKEKF